MKLDDLFDKVVYINMKKNQDRNDHMIKLLSGLSSNYERIEATVPENQGAFSSIGEHGCFLSHLGIVKKLADQNCKLSIIMEDDCCFTEDFANDIQAIVSEINRTEDCDVVFFHGAPAKGDNPTGLIYRKGAPFCTHFYVVKNPAKLLKLLQMKHSSGIDAVYANSNHHINFYRTSKQYAYQVPGYSDICNSYVIRDSRDHDRDAPHIMAKLNSSVSGKRVNLLLYKNTGNLGDTSQTIGLMNLFNDYNFDFVYRNANTVEYKESENHTIVNGCIGSFTKDKMVHYCGIHLAGWPPRDFDKDTWIACRDPWTYKKLQSNGFKRLVLIGCSTLLFSRYEGKRSGVYYVNARSKIGKGLLYDNSNGLYGLYASSQALSKMRTAEIVFTDRLHVMLPCIAFGTPVVYDGNEINKTNPRLSILNEYDGMVGLGLPPLNEMSGKYIIRDVDTSSLTKSYREYIANTCELEIPKADPDYLSTLTKRLF